MSSCEDGTPTHSIPMALQRKLAEAKHWRDRLEALADDADEYHSDKEAVDLLKEIVEMCGQAWGFAD